MPIQRHKGRRRPCVHLCPVLFKQSLLMADTISQLKDLQSVYGNRVYSIYCYRNCYCSCNSRCHVTIIVVVIVITTNQCIVWMKAKVWALIATFHMKKDINVLIQDLSEVKLCRLLRLWVQSQSAGVMLNSVQAKYCQSFTWPMTSVSNCIAELLIGLWDIVPERHLIHKIMQCSWDLVSLRYRRSLFHVVWRKSQ